MKKLLTIGLILINIFLVHTAFADDPATAEGGETAATPTCAADESGESFNVNCLAVVGDDGKIIQSSALTKKDPMQIVLNAVVFITKVTGSIAILILVIAGLLMITSMHKEQQITRAKEMFVGALIGIVITFTAYILATFVQSLFYT